MTNTNNKTGAIAQLLENMQQVDVSIAVKELQSWRNPVTNRYLEKSAVEKYVKSAELVQVLLDLKQAQKSLSKSAMLAGIGVKNMTELYEATFEIIEMFGLSLPKSRRIESYLKKYKKEGVKCFISKKRTLKNATKGDDIYRKFLGALLFHPNRLDSKQIASIYNNVVTVLGKEEFKMSDSNIRKIKNEGFNMLAHLEGSQGKAGIKRLMMYRDRFRPAESLKFVSLDGWDVELAYKRKVKVRSKKTGNPGEQMMYNFRHNVVVISDACCDFPIGWAVAEKETSALIKQAIRKAMHYIKDKTGKFYHFMELKTDTFGSGKLKDTYNRVVSTKYSPAAVGNSNDKPIEQWFKILNKKCQLEYNWTGYGNQAKTKHNSEQQRLTAYKKMQPTQSENLEQIERILTDYRNEQLDVWLAMFDTSILKEMSVEQYLLALGDYKLDRSQNHQTYRLGHEGIKVIRNGEKFFYQTFDKEFKEYALVDWEMIEDPLDYNNVLMVSEDRTLRFLLHRQQQSPMAISDRIAEKHNEYDGLIEGHNKGIVQQILKSKEESYKATEMIYAELMKHGTSTKEIEKLMPIINGQQKTYQKVNQVQKAIEESIDTDKYEIDDDSISAALSAF